MAVCGRPTTDNKRPRLQQLRRRRRRLAIDQVSCIVFAAAVNDAFAAALCHSCGMIGGLVWELSLLSMKSGSGKERVEGNSLQLCMSVSMYVYSNNNF